MAQTLGELYTRDMQADGYLSQRDLTLHFGIADYRIEIQWQRGVKQLIKSVPVNQGLSLEEGRDE